MYLKNSVLERVIKYNGNDVKRLNHILKVFTFACYMADKEGCENSIQQTIELAALLHDIGIHESEKKYHSSAGNWQQIEGPPVARELMKGLPIPDHMKERVCYLIAHHHTYDSIDGLDYQILVEADFLVNIFEDQMDSAAVQNIKKTIFKTESGLSLLTELYS